VRDVGRAQHASAEQLSALLDNRSEPDEQAFLAEHVGVCVVCGSELADLRAVRALLRAMPVYQPPRSFTIPVPEALPVLAASVAPAHTARLWLVPQSRLVPFTRALSALAAVLCVVLFSADAMQTSFDRIVSLQDGAGAMQITAARAPASSSGARSAAETESESAPQPAESKPAAAAAKPAAAQSGAAAKPASAQPAEAAKPAAAQPAGAAKPAARAVDSAVQRPAPVPAPPAPAAAEAPPQSAAPRAAAQPAPAAPQPTGAAQPPGTVAAFAATQPAAVPTAAAATSGQTSTVAPPPAADAEIAARPAVPPSVGERMQPASATATTRGMTPLRIASSVFAVVAAILLVMSLALGRADRERRNADVSRNGR
jgi:hypothetical protein